MHHVRHKKVDAPLFVGSQEDCNSFLENKVHPSGKHLCYVLPADALIPVEKKPMNEGGGANVTLGKEKPVVQKEGQGQRTVLTEKISEAVEEVLHVVATGGEVAAEKVSEAVEVKTETETLGKKIGGLFKKKK